MTKYLEINKPKENFPGSWEEKYRNYQEDQDM